VGKGENLGEIVAKEENILLYWTDKTSSGRKIRCCTVLRRKAKEENLLKFTL
jgi:hypothetical protein